MTKTIIIAEAGVNHNGSIEIAKKLIDAAVEAGVDYVKFQTFKANKIVAKSASKASYQKKNTDAEESQYEMLKRLELSEDDHLELINYCKERNIAFLSTAFDIESVDLLKSLGIDLGKIPSGELTNLPLIRKMAKVFSKIVLSTGMANSDEIRAIVNELYLEGVKSENLTILHCNTEYPTPFEDVNLKAMNTIKDEIGVKIGYSDHTLGIEVPIAAVALGATLIEKHFTLDRNMEGPDHKASLEPNELKAMVTAIRNIEKALSGNGSKVVSPSESQNRLVARKSIVASLKINKGDVLTEKNISVKRPGTGISPMQWDAVIGTKAKMDFNEDELIVL